MIQFELFPHLYPKKVRGHEGAKRNCPFMTVTMAHNSVLNKT